MRDRQVPPPAGRGRAPTPRAMPITVHCPGEPGDTPRSPPMLRWVGTNTRTDTGVQQSLNLADSQPGTQCTHGRVRADGGTPSPGPSPARAYTRWKTVSALLTLARAHCFANVRQHALNPVDIGRRVLLGCAHPELKTPRCSRVSHRPKKDIQDPDPTCGRTS